VIAKLENIVETTFKDSEKVRQAQEVILQERREVKDLEDKLKAQIEAEKQAQTEEYKKQCEKLEGVL